MEYRERRNIAGTVLLVLVMLPSVVYGQRNSEMAGLQTAAQQDTLAEGQDQMLIGLLDSSLGSLAETNRRGRMVGGYVLLGLGIGSGLGGAATLAFGEGDDARIVGYSLIGGGVVLSGLSLIPFRVKSETERFYEEFRSMPENSPAQIHRKYIYWDRRFEELAAKRRNERIIGGVTTIVAAGATSLFLVEGSDEERVHSFIWPAVGGVTALLVKTEEERRYESYAKAREDITGRSYRSEVYFGLSPLPVAGLLGTVLVRF